MTVMADKERDVAGDAGADEGTVEDVPAAETVPDGGIDEDDDNRVDVQPGTGDTILPAERWRMTPK